MKKALLSLVTFVEKVNSPGYFDQSRFVTLIKKLLTICLNSLSCNQNVLTINPITPIYSPKHQKPWGLGVILYGRVLTSLKV